MARLDAGSLSLNGNVTLTGSPNTQNGNWLKCTDCNKCCVIEGGFASNASTAATTKITAHCGGTELQPGDWLMMDGHHGGYYKHHFIYVGNGEFVSRQTNGVVLEGRAQYQNKKAYLIYRGGLACANKAKSRIGEKGYNLASNNCEHFCSDCCGLGHKSEQVFVSSGKAMVKLGSALANAVNSNPNMKFTSSMQGGFSSMGGFSMGVSFSF
eukprot:CAMPEP_0202693762 /NCGR_PEP_ID=MMETSP1385-20130828/7797_1 /ASSEMBLY_ACC=CAM_ASM_000861 /TAXON_ID=933848 /ORGANISM="Elphidium margaritaceum" /LENGTH=210 /DNA_ID=CAMNT_0049349493 /DNA_START=94 /DNA_END=726 /DNA_ORIENTATION=+